jgi:GntR family transcriptional regulator
MAGNPRAAQATNRLQRDPRPLYQQVQDVLVADIGAGLYESGGRLPTEEELAAQLGVSRPTIRTALANLESSGYIRRVHGGGTFVAEKPTVVENPLDFVESLHPHRARIMGLTSRLTDLSIDRVPADEGLAARMSRPVGTPVARVSRVVEVEEMPIVHFVDLIPEDVVTVEEVRAGFRDNVIDFLADRGIVAGWYEMTVSATRAHPPISTLLRVGNGSILLVFDGDFVTEDGDFLNVSTAHFVPESVKLTARRRVKPHPVPEPAGRRGGQRAQG